MELQKLKNVLNRFASGLPKTNVAFLYFIKDTATQSYLPKVNTIAAEWNIPEISQPLYVIPGIHGDGYLYIYKSSELKYEVILRNNKDVIGFQSSSRKLPSTPVIGGSLLNNVNWGNHLTIGINKSFISSDILLMTHKTIYIENPNDPIHSQRDEVKCNIVLNKTLTESCSCIEAGRPTQNTLDIYKKNALDPDAFLIIKNIHSILMNPSAYGGRRGQKGGVRPRGGAFTNRFIAFFLDRVIHPISVSVVNLYECIVMDEGEEHIAIRYNYGDDELSDSRLFIVARTMVIEVEQAYNVPLIRRSIQDANVLDRFDLWIRSQIPVET